MSNQIRVVLADDHPVYRAGLRLILDSADDIEVIGEAADGVVALDLVRKHQPDILLLDVTMPVQGGIETARICHEEDIHSPAKTTPYITAKKWEALPAITNKCQIV